MKQCLLFDFIFSPKNFRNNTLKDVAFVIDDEEFKAVFTHGKKCEPLNLLKKNMCLICFLRYEKYIIKTKGKNILLNCLYRISKLNSQPITVNFIILNN